MRPISSLLIACLLISTLLCHPRHHSSDFCLFRLVQKAELTRLSQTFLHVPQLHWIVVEDSPHKTPLVTDLLVKSGLTYTHLHMPTTKDHKLQEVGGGCQSNHTVFHVFVP